MDAPPPLARTERLSGDGAKAVHKWSGSFPSYTAYLEWFYKERCEACGGLVHLHHKTLRNPGSPKK